MIRIMMWGEQKKRVWSVAVTILQIMSWVSATRRPLPHEAQGQCPQSLQVQWQPKEVFFGKDKEEIVHEEALKRSKTLGSRPPSCVRKCGQCNPCEAVQVPTTPENLGLQLQYANYEPESWKCKCRNSLFNP